MLNDISCLSAIADDSQIYTNIPVKLRRWNPHKNDSEKTLSYIDFVFTGTNGIYVFGRSVEALERFTEEAHIPMNQAYLFLNDTKTNTTYLYDLIEQKQIPLTNEYENFETFYDNHRIPQVDLPHYNFPDLESYLYEQTPDEFKEAVTYTGNAVYVKPIIAVSELNEIEKQIEKLIQGDSSKIRINEDGIWEVKKTLSRHLMLMDTFIPIKEKWYPCIEKDPDQMYLVTFLGGMLGAHRWINKQFGSALLYTLTCGLGGVGYVYDLFTMLMGNYHVQDNEYVKDSQKVIHLDKHVNFLKPIGKKMRALLLLLISIPLAYATVRFVYLPVYRVVAMAISSVIAPLLQHSSSVFGL